MKFTILSDKLKPALAAAVACLERKGAIPVLSHVLIESVGKDTLKITATDLDTTVVREVAATVQTPGAMCIQGKKLADITNTLDVNCGMEFEKEANEWVKLKAARSNFRLAGVSRDQYPSLPPGIEMPLTIPRETLLAMIHKTGFAITQEQSRFVLSGAKFEVADGKMRMVSTDGHRLSFIETALKSKHKFDLLIPKKALIEAQKIEGEEIRYGADTNHVFFAADGHLLIARKLSGNFPNYELVLPKDNDKKVTMPAGDFKAVVKRASLMSSVQGQKVTIEFTKDQARICSDANDEGSLEEIIETDYAGEAETLAFNWHYLLDFLSVADDEKRVTLAFKDANGQAEFGIEGEEEFRHIIMPLKI